MGLMIFLMFDTYARPGEMTELLAEQLIHPPGMTTSGPDHQWGLLIRPSGEGLAPAKTGEHNETVLLSSRCEFVLPALQRLRAMIPGTNLLWPVDVAKLNQVLSRAAALAGVSNLGITSYAFRHGGASADFFYGLRSIEEIKHRGRWKSDSSLRRYQKAGMYQKQRSLMTSTAMAYAQQVDAVLPQAFLALHGDLVRVHHLLHNEPFTNGAQVQEALRQQVSHRHVMPSPPLQP